MGGLFGGGGSSAPSDDKNTLRSSARARILLCVGEGQIEGFVNPTLARSVYLDGTPLESPTGILNFQGFSVDWRSGTPDQPYIPGFSKSEIEGPPIAQIVRNSIPVVRTIFDPTVNAARVRIRLPALRKATDKGLKGNTTRYLIEVASAGSAYQRIIDQTISGKTDSPYERSHEFVLNGKAPWDIRVVRPDADSNDVKIEDSVIFQSLTEVQYEQQRYPNAALLSIDIDAQQFDRSLPSVSFRIRGLRVLIPHNYDPYTRTYTGSFNGTLVPGWTNNPAWILYDILTDERYGAGLSPSLLEIYDFYEAALHCDEKVSNGEGGTENRWTFNANIESRDEAFNVATAIAASFNAKLIPKGSRIGLLVDKLRKPIRNYGHHNVEVKRNENGEITSGPFQYRTISVKAINTVAVVSYREPAEDYETKEITVRDEVGIAKLGYKPVSLTALGCTSRTQAKRYGLWKLYTDRLQSRMVTFRVASEGMLAEPGEVIGITDKNLAGVRLSGRISDVKADPADFLLIDHPITMTSTEQFTVMTVGVDGKIQENPVDASRTAMGSPTRAIYLLDRFASLPPIESSWAVRSASISPNQFIISAVNESDDGGYQIEAIQYVPEKYAAIESNAAIARIRTTNLPDPFLRPEIPTNLNISEYLAEASNGAVEAHLDFSWAYPESGFIQLDHFEIELKAADDTSWTTVASTKLRGYTFKNLPSGAYSFRVSGVNRLGLKGSYAEINRSQSLSLLDAPRAVRNLQIVKADNRSAFLKWTYIEELDVRKGGYFLIKHSPKVTGATWADGLEIARVEGNVSEAVVPFREGTYQIRTFDSSGQYSVEVAQVSTVYAFRDPNNVLKVFQESPVFAGVKVNLATSSGLLRLVPSERFDTIDEPFDGNPPPFDSYALSSENYEPEGYYYFSEDLVLDATYPVYIYGVVGASVLSRNDVFDSQPGPFDSLPNGYFGGPASTVSAFVGTPRTVAQISLSLDGLIYGEWTNLLPGEYLLKTAKFRAYLETKVAILTPEVSELQVIVDVPDRQESGRLTTSVTAATTITYDAAFLEIPSPQFTVLNQEAGDQVTLIGESQSSISFEIRNAGARVSRDVSWTVKGYGKRIN